MSNKIKVEDIKLGDRIEFFVGWETTDTGEVIALTPDSIVVMSDFLKREHVINKNKTRSIYKL